jgi:hypothetical protein
MNTAWVSFPGPHVSAGQLKTKTTERCAPDTVRGRHAVVQDRRYEAVGRAVNRTTLKPWGRRPAVQVTRPDKFPGQAMLAGFGLGV